MVQQAILRVYTKGENAKDFFVEAPSRNDLGKAEQKDLKTQPTDSLYSSRLPRGSHAPKCQCRCLECLSLLLSDRWKLHAPPEEKPLPAKKEALRPRTQNSDPSKGPFYISGGPRSYKIAARGGASHKMATRGWSWDSYKAERYISSGYGGSI